MPFHYMETVFRNRIIAAMPPDELRQIRPLLTRVRLVRGQVIYDSGERIDQLYFIEEGLVSMAPPHHSAREQVEVDAVGRQSVVGLTALINAEAISFHRAMVQMAGVAYRIPAAAARDYLSRMPLLKRLLMEELEISCARLSQNSACRSKHSLAERLARWLVMARDLADSDTLNVTQEILASMLAVRRPGVTVALGRLEASGLIRQRRGNVIVCNRDELSAVACDCDTRLQNYMTSSMSGRTRPSLAFHAPLQHSHA